MGIFSHYAKPRHDVGGGHHHNITYKVITAHANEVIEIKVGSNASHTPQHIENKKSVHHGFGRHPNGPVSDATHLAHETRNINSELARRRKMQEHPLTLADYVDR